MINKIAFVALAGLATAYAMTAEAQAPQFPTWNGYTPPTRFQPPVPNYFAPTPNYYGQPPVPLYGPPPVPRSGIIFGPNGSSCIITGNVGICS
jgi:hypothetical protein